MQASLEDLIHGPGVIMVMSQQLGGVTHHRPATPIFTLMHRGRVRDKENSVTPSIIFIAFSPL